MLTYRALVKGAEGPRDPRVWKGPYVSQQIQYFYTCDLEGPDAPDLTEEEVFRRRFSLGRQEYEIDLCAAHNATFSGHLAQYIERAYRPGKRPLIRETVYESSRPARPATTAPADTRPAGRAGRTRRPPEGRVRVRQIRAWAKQRGLKVNERGRIPASIVAEYEAAH
jgi:hypothetical protein